jgi:hypothetical protein
MANSGIIVRFVVLLLPGEISQLPHSTVLFGLKNGLSGDKLCTELAVKVGGVTDGYAITLKNVWSIFLNGKLFHQSE